MCWENLTESPDRDLTVVVLQTRQISTRRHKTDGAFASFLLLVLLICLATTCSTQQSVYARLEWFIYLPSAGRRSSFFSADFQWIGWSSMPRQVSAAVSRLLIELAELY